MKNQEKWLFFWNQKMSDEIFTVDLTVNTYCQIDGEDFVNFCGLLRKRELYLGMLDFSCSILHFDISKSNLAKQV